MEIYTLVIPHAEHTLLLVTRENVNTQTHCDNILDYPNY